MTTRLIILACVFTLFSACTKKKSCPSTMELTATNRTPTIGDGITIMAPHLGDNGIYQWYGPGLNGITNSSTLTFSSIKLSQRGIYSCNYSNSDCNISLVDTIFIDVKLKQENPPCTLTNNYVSCSNIPNVTLRSVTKAFDPTWNGVALSGYGGYGYPTFLALFNSYNGNTEPLDGVYITTDRQVFDLFQELNEISVSFIYASTFYHCNAGQKVYVSHVAGKLVVSFCNLVCSGPPLPSTTITGKMTQQ